MIDRALALAGFQQDQQGREVTVGFARNAVLGVAAKVIEAVKSGAIRHFFLVAGCDGYITKPIDTRTMPTTLRGFLDTPKKS